MALPIIRSRGTRMIATGFSSPPGNRVRARRIECGASVEIARQRRGLIVSGHLQGVAGDIVEPGQPHPDLILAPLRDHLREQVELGETGIEEAGAAG